tara:strand:+ start:202 stop:786 length:585 start_codon:yes stop_codon:yes gene_type:complete
MYHRFYPIEISLFDKKEKKKIANYFIKHTDEPEQLPQYKIQNHGFDWEEYKIKAVKPEDLKQSLKYMLRGCVVGSYGINNDFDNFPLLKQIIPLNCRVCLKERYAELRGEYCPDLKKKKWVKLPVALKQEGIEFDESKWHRSDYDAMIAASLWDAIEKIEMQQKGNILIMNNQNSKQDIAEVINKNNSIDAIPF